mgnify:CR=1 FL=1
MKTQKNTKIEAVEVRKSSIRCEKSDNTSLPPTEESRKIILDMLLKGCYVRDIYERFGVKCPDE